LRVDNFEIVDKVWPYLHRCLDVRIATSL